MKITLLYLNVTKSGYASAPPPEYYVPFSERWVETYKRFNPGVDHNVRILSCGAPPTQAVRDRYSSISCDFDTYLGAGSDIGGCQSALKNMLDQDYVLCMSTPVYFWRDGWLKKMVDAVEWFGDGLYGPMASYQHTPHIRTSCWLVKPATFGRYPHLIDNREKCCWAEHADHGDELWQISRWYEHQHKPVLMVTWDQVLAKSDWRTPPNIFRRGDQTNCLVWDQHVDVYRCAHYHERLALEKMANGI